MKIFPPLQFSPPTMALEEKHWVGLNSAVAYFATWAIRQSPT